MFKKTLLIITSTIFIAQLASFFEKNYIGENADSLNKSLQVSINREEEYIYKHLDNMPLKQDMPNKKTSPRLYNNATIVNYDKHIHIPLYTMLNIKSCNLIANS